MGKVKLYEATYEGGFVDLFQFPMGKVKKNFTEQLENSINVSIPYGKGKDNEYMRANYEFLRFNSLWER